MTHIEQFQKIAYIKEAKTRWMKMLAGGHLNPQSVDRLVPAMGQAITRRMHRTNNGLALGHGAEGMIFKSKLPGGGQGATKVFYDAPMGSRIGNAPLFSPKGVSPTSPTLGNFTLSERQKFMRQYAGDIFPPLHAQGSRGFTMPILKELPANQSRLSHTWDRIRGRDVLPFKEILSARRSVRDLEKRIRAHDRGFRMSKANLRLPHERGERTFPWQKKRVDIGDFGPFGNRYRNVLQDPSTGRAYVSDPLPLPKNIQIPQRTGPAPRLPWSRTNNISTI